MHMNVNRGLVFWGMALVAAGAVALLVQSGAIPDEAARGLWRFWPVALIAAGLAVIASRTPFALVATVVAALVVGGLAGSLVAGWPGGLSVGCGGEPTERMSDEGTFGGSRADVELRMNCGDLAISTASGDGWSVDARHGRDGRPRLTSDGGSLQLVVEGSGPIAFAETRQDWRIVLPTDVELDLDVSANAASSRLDLADAELSRLRLNTNAGDVRVGLEGASVEGLALEMNAGSVRITADGDTALSGEVGMNAGSLELCAPDAAGVEIVLDDPNVTFSHNLDSRGFTESGDTWRSGSGTPAIRLVVDGNAASFRFNPDGGCS
jgi:hypothetical protein